MPYRWGDHVGELELHVTAGTEAGVFRDAALALGELLGEEDPAPSPVESRELSIGGVDLAGLLADWLDELVFLGETEGFVPEDVTGVEVGADRLTAVVAGRRGSPPHLVKAVTRHRLRFEPASGGWSAGVVLDV